MRLESKPGYGPASSKPRARHNIMQRHRHLDLPWLLGLAALAVFTGAGLAAETPSAWPRFRGPNGSGVAEGQQPPVDFGPEKNLKWKVAVPPGLSSPIAAGDNLVITALDDDKLWTIAYDRASGKEAWRAQAPAAQLEPYHKKE